MIRFLDALTIARTKMKTHKVRTSLAIGISGILFGLLVLVIVVSQGVFMSVANFGSEGLNGRFILYVSNMSDDNQTVYDQRLNSDFVLKVEQTYNQRISSKKAIAKKYSIDFNPAIDDPSPVVYDKDLKQKVVKEEALSSPDVKKVYQAYLDENIKKFSIDDFIKPYKSARVIQKLGFIMPSSGQLAMMKDGKEGQEADQSASPGDIWRGPSDDKPTLQLIDGGLAKPFITTTFDASKGEIPIILPNRSAEKHLGMKPLGESASSQQKYDRLLEVRKRIGDIRIEYCYRNGQSLELLQKAISQKEEIAKNQNDSEYVKPKIVYKLPSDDSCGPVEIASDTRSAIEKKQQDNYLAYQKEIGEYNGDPAQQKIVFRGVGMSGDVDFGSNWSMANMVQGLLSSNLGFGAWSIPTDLLEKVPSQFHPSDVFASGEGSDPFLPNNYLVEFNDKQEALSVLNKYSQNHTTIAGPFGNGALVMDEVKIQFNKILDWVLLAVGGIAMIILMSMIGRTVAEGRRESAVFRAIGASRKDIGAIYGAYTILLSLRVVIFALFLGLGIALIVQFLYGHDATIGAKLAYSAQDTDKQFILFSLSSPYLLWVITTIMAAGILSSIIPILMGARRNPINDMRNET